MLRKPKSCFQAHPKQGSSLEMPVIVSRKGAEVLPFHLYVFA